jgi:hypothetical protein
MPEEISNPTETRQIVPAPAPAPQPPTVGQMPDRQLSELPRDELTLLAEELGLHAADYRTQQNLVSAVHERRNLIASLDREAMLDVVRWGRRPVSISAGKDHLALEIAKIRSMRFAGLSQRGLIVLARLRGTEVAENEQVPVLIRKLRKQEGIFRRFNRKRRSFLGSVVANIVGENESSKDYKFLPPAAGPGNEGPASSGQASNHSTIKEEIEESGLFGGISNRLKKTADQYLNQKLDEIEARIDQKLDDIDRRLTEWRDKEIANRIRILKITLWASVIVGVVSLIYSYVMQYIVH